METRSDGLIKLDNIMLSSPSYSLPLASDASTLPSSCVTTPSATNPNPNPSTLPPKKSFTETVPPNNHGVSIDVRFVQVVGGKRLFKEGKDSPDILTELVISPNDAMLKEIAMEKS